jgi:tetratricopeptide (TPR) repeat protein
VVAIKYTAARSREPQVLAALQHPNIMPVWSVHESAGHRVFCMPLHGRTTVADVLKMIDRTKSLPATGAGFLSAASVTEAEAETAVPLPADTPTATEMVLADDAPEYESDRRRLEKLGYVDSVVQGVTRLADALAHAHRRRVVHLDIKPANILITDDGGFMILDFGLAYQNGLPASPEAGGTVRYMAPEQLVTFVAGKGVRPDPRMDLYALGLVFFELLTGRHPFAESLTPGTRREEWVNARHRQPPRVRRFNPAVPPGVEAVVLKLLHPDRGERYQSAEQVLTDLTRQQNNEPLLHAHNPSVWERFLKFRRRHPVFSVAVMAAVMAVLAVGGYWVAYKQAEDAKDQIAARETAEANKQLTAMLADLTPARIDAGSLQSADARRQAVAVADKWQAAYHTEPTGAWRRQPAFARLTDAERQQATASLGELALLAAHAERLNAIGRTTDESDAALERAVVWNARAEAIYTPTPPAAVQEQRAALARQTGRTLPPLPLSPPADNTDLYLRALGQVADGDHRGATATLEELERREPQHAAGQFALGFVYQSAGRFGPAAERYQVAKALADRDPRAAFNRGAMNLYNRHPDEAVADLTTALDRDPKLVDGYYMRASGRLQMAARVTAEGNTAGLERRYAQALSDIDTALQLGGPRYRYLYLRSLIRAQAGDAAGADADRKTLDATTPDNDLDYICRAYRRIRDGRAVEALTDFARATERNPLNPTAWHNLAAQQAAVGQTAAAAESYANVIRLMPDLTSAKFKRAVLLARLGECQPAVALIDGLTPPDTECLMIKASVFALTSQYNLNDRTVAFACLTAAARVRAVDWDAYDQDPDFDHVRDLPVFLEFRERKGRPVE